MIARSFVNWLVKNPGIVEDYDYGSGFNTESGFAYDILLKAGWQFPDDHHRIAIVQTASEALKLLRRVMPCDCGECREEMGKPPLTKNPYMEISHIVDEHIKKYR